MFVAVAMVCFFSTVISVEQVFTELNVLGPHDMRVTIRIEGDTARRYLENAKSSSLSASFKKDGTLLLTAVANAIDEGTVRVRHTSIVRVVGQPLELLSMETVINKSMMVIDPDAPETESSAQDRLYIRLPEIQPVEIQAKNIVGGFPDSPRYN